MGQWYRVVQPFSSKLQRFPLNYEFDEATVYRVNEYPTTAEIVALGLIMPIAAPADSVLPPETFMLEDAPQDDDPEAQAAASAEAEATPPVAASEEGGAQP